MNNESNIYTYEEMCEQIKKCGQSIIDNAESILGNERYFVKTTVSFDIDRAKDKNTVIKISREFIPEKQIEDDATYEELKQRRINNKTDKTNILKEHEIMKRILVEHGLWETLLNDSEFNEYLREEWNGQ